MNNQLAIGGIISEATSILRSNGYKVVRAPDLSLNLGENSLLAEDQYGVLAIVLSKTVGELVENWADRQAELVAYLDAQLAHGDPKAWEAYLVLMTPAPLTPKYQSRLEKIRLDINRVRKLTITGDSLETMSDVSRALMPLLPIDETNQTPVRSSLLKDLPPMLDKHGVDKEDLRVVIKAFDDQESIMQKLHDHLKTDAT